MNPYFIWNKYTNNWINHHISIANLLWQTIDNYFKICLCQLTEVFPKFWLLNSNLWTGSCIVFSLLMEVAPSTCICVMDNTFWPNYWSKLSWWTKYCIHNFNVTNLNLFKIEIWIPSPSRYQYLMWPSYILLAIYKNSTMFPSSF